MAGGAKPFEVRLTAGAEQDLEAICDYIAGFNCVAHADHVLDQLMKVAVVWQGRKKLHYLNPVPLFDIQERWIRKFERNRLGVLHTLKTRLEGADRGPEKT